MQNYNCSVNVGGSVQTRVPKFSISAAEIIVLRQIHGHDAVIKIKPTTTDNGPHSKIRAHIESVYGAKRVTQIFGVAGTRLPTELDDVSRIAHLSDDDDDDAPVVAAEAAAPEPAAPEPAPAPAQIDIEDVAPRGNSGKFQKKAA